MIAYDFKGEKRDRERLFQSWGIVRKPVAVTENTKLPECILEEIRPG